MSTTPFPELDEVLERFVGRVCSILGENLVGVYLTGSFALGEGDAASDCDFLVVTERKASDSEERELRRLHEELLEWDGYWAHNLEGSYAPKPDLQTLAALGEPWLYANRGHRELEWSAHCNTEDVRWVLHERSPTLVGADAREFAVAVPAELLRASMRTRIESFLEDVRSWAPFAVSWTQRYVVESMSRMLCTLERGEIVGKQTALDWAEARVPVEWRDLIRQVRRDRATFVWNDPPRPGSMERSIAFAEYGRERARTT